MTITRSFSLSLGLVLAGLLTGCAHFPGGIAPSNTPLEGRKYTVLSHTEATDSRICLLGFLPVTSANSTRKAMDDAAIRAGGDALIDVIVEGYYQYWILFSRDVTRVEGTAIRFNK